MTTDVNGVRAVVRELLGEQAIVEIATAGCGRCHEKGGCGGQQLTQMFCRGPRRYQVENAVGARVGDPVLVVVDAGALRRSANLAYVLPVAALILGALLGNWLAADVGAIVGGGLALCGAFVVVRVKVPGASGNRACRPHILSRLTENLTEKQEESSP